MSARSGPLCGVRIVDLTRALAGPYCTMLLGDLGADIIKVEPPGGDMTRTLGPHPKDRAATDYGAYFASINRNKRSIVLDLKSDADRETLLALIDHADALVENFRPGVMDRLGLAYETLHARKKSLVYGAVRGFGDPRTGESPYADWPAFDIIAQAMGGVVSSTGEPGTTGVRSGPAVGDIFPGTLAALGVVSAILHARSSGEGQFLDVSMYDAMLNLCESLIYNYDISGEVHPPSGNAHPSLVPFDVYATANGAVALAAPTDKHWRILCEIVGSPEHGRDPRFKETAGRVAHRAEVRELLEGFTRTRTTAEVVESLAGRVPVGPVNTPAEIFADPHIASRQMLARLDYPGSGEQITVANNAIKLTGTPSGAYRRAPHLGEHAREIFAELGIPGPVPSTPPSSSNE
ncbi:MAG: CoA transferase [Myxococcales bacterium]|nr:CoA transferase [Myxococcales bacterium]